ncbi:MAG: flagellar protein FlaG [Butyrivibrio sp.]|nr:flagellar protein FlaG [Butyrivibrio sp.]
MAIESISNEMPKAYTTTDVSTSVARPEFQTVEPVKAQKKDYESKDETEDKAAYKSSVPSEGTIKQAISDINKKINPNTVAEYGYHDETNRVTIKIVDKETDKTIKEFPAEETLDMIAKVWELAGMFLDEKG